MGAAVGGPAGPITILDGPMGTELGARGLPTPPPLWSALALREAPEVVAEIHRGYAAAGASVHTTNTFRARRRAAPGDWERLARRAVALARGAVPAGHRIAGSVAPLEDCYRPDLSPPDPGPEHRELAGVLADAGVDLLLCETFPHVGEALAAVEACAETGLPVWVAFTAGYRADLLTPAEIHRGAAAAIERGASAVLVNCVPASRTRAYLEPLAGLGVPFGAYANAGAPAEGLGWGDPDGDGPERYAEIAQGWADLGATLIGACCGTGAAHVRALAERLG